MMMVPVNTGPAQQPRRSARWPRASFDGRARDVRVGARTGGPPLLEGSTEATPHSAPWPNDMVCCRRADVTPSTRRRPTATSTMLQDQRFVRNMFREIGRRDRVLLSIVTRQTRKSARASGWSVRVQAWLSAFPRNTAGELSHRLLSAASVMSASSGARRPRIMRVARRRRMRVPRAMGRERRSTEACRLLRDARPTALNNWMDCATLADLVRRWTWRKCCLGCSVARAQCSPQRSCWP